MTNNYIYIYIYMLFNVLINSKKKCVNKINTFKINYSGGSSSISTLPNIINELRDFTQNNMNKDFNEKIYIRIFDNVDEEYIVKDNYNLHIPEKYINNTDLLNDIKSKIGDIHIIFVKDLYLNSPLTEENEGEDVETNFNDMNFGSVLIYRNIIFLKNNIDKDEDYILTEINKIEDKKNLKIYRPEGVIVFESDLYNKIEDIINEPKSNENELNISYNEDNDTSISSNSNKNNDTSTSSNNNKNNGISTSSNSNKNKKKKNKKKK